MICVVGSFMMDLVARTPRLPAPGETVRGHSFESFLGGKGFNQAVAASRSEAPTRMVGTVGADAYGDAFLRALDDEGIDRRHVRVDDREGTGVGLPRVDDDGLNSIVVIPRANLCMAPRELDGSRDWLDGVSVVLLQLELPIAAVAHAATAAKQAGCLVVLNPAPGQRELSALRGLVDIVVPNEVEAATVAGLEPSVDPVRAGRGVAEALASARVVVTLGERGTLLLDDQAEPRHVPAHDVACVDSVGAGDAFCGALAASLARDVPLADAVAYANAAGALAVTRPGAEPSMPRAREVRALIEGSSAEWRVPNDEHPDDASRARQASPT